MKIIAESVLALALCSGCISMLAERSEGNLKLISMACLDAVPEAITIRDQREAFSEMSWTATTGEKSCKCVKRTISEMPGYCVLVAEGQK